jgi:hypothetical protein
MSTAFGMLFSSVTKRWHRRIEISSVCNRCRSSSTGSWPRPFAFYNVHPYPNAQQYRPASQIFRIASTALPLLTSNLPLLRPPIPFTAIEMTLSMHNIFKCQNKGLRLEEREFDEQYEELICLLRSYCEDAFCDMLSDWSINMEMGEWNREMLEQEGISKPTASKDTFV